MSYLTEEEIPIYANLIAGVGMAQVEAASTLIDAYKGCSFLPQQNVEYVELRHKRYGPTRGKLSHFPRICVDKIKCKTFSPFGPTTIDLPVESLEFDDDSSMYFTFCKPRELMFQSEPRSLTVTYHSGYDELPEALKRATGILACNIKQMGGVMRWKQRDDYDIKVTLGDSGVFTEEVKAILRGIDVK